jgi:hypothetical protein
MADIIDELLGMDDAALSKKIGFADKLQVFKNDIGRASKLSGDARTKVVDHLKRTFAPSSYAIEDIGYTVDRAEKKADGKTTPEDITNCCCGDPD